MKRVIWESRLNSLWYGNSNKLSMFLLLPLSWLYCAATLLRRLVYQSGFLRSGKLNAIVIVVGNITVGGTGKTPLVIALVALLKDKGYSAGVICRGYGSRCRRGPVQALVDSSPQDVGDEAVLLARATGGPVFVGRDRVSTARALLARHPVDIIISDDGLQHYALQRDLEVLVVDGQRQLGNRHCLPAGPLREPVSRLGTADAVIEQVAEPAASGFWMQYRVSQAISLTAPETHKELKKFIGKQGYLVAGTGNNDRFFYCLQSRGINFKMRGFADHQFYQPADLAFAGDAPVLMTDKDAVKCEAFATDNWWRVPLETRLAPEFQRWVADRLDTLSGRKNDLG